LWYNIDIHCVKRQEYVMFLKNLLLPMVLMLASACGLASNNDGVVGFVADRGTEVVLAYKAPCSNKALSMVPEHLKEGWNEAKFLSPTNTMKGCWKEYENVVLLVWEDGVKGTMFQSEFRLLRST
jgi:hypothetical protein